MTAISLACDCRGEGIKPCQEYWRADVVFIGTVATIRTVPKKEGAYEFRRQLVTFAVGEAFRGIRSGQADIFTGGGDCGYSFKTGETYFVYAYRNKEDGTVSTSICTRTRPLAQATEDLSYIRALASAVAGGVIFGKVQRNRTITLLPRPVR